MLDSVQNTKLINVEKNTMDKLSISVYRLWVQLLCVGLHDIVCLHLVNMCLVGCVSHSFSASCLSSEV